MTDGRTEQMKGGGRKDGKKENRKIGNKEDIR
jgi:hypothetical protein